MTQTQNKQEAILTINTDGTAINDYLKKRLDKITENLLQLAPDILRLDVYLTESAGTTRPVRKVSARLALPGINFHATDSGFQWKLLFKHVELRLSRSIEKRKELMRKESKKSIVLPQLDPAA